MAILEIVTVPHPVLSQRCRPVRDDEFGPELEQRVRDMAETMYAAPGVGLAAPQVADDRRFLVADPGGQEEGAETRRGQNLMVLVNPEVLWASHDRATFEEGCLSVPEFWEEIVRPRHVRLRWRDARGEQHEGEFKGYPAVVLQHEIDHLEGVTLLDKVSRFKRSRYLKRRAKKSAQG